MSDASIPHGHTASRGDATPRGRAADEGTDQGDTAPGDNPVKKGLLNYSIGLGLATLLTVASFLTAGTNFIYGPGLPTALVALAIAQIGVHLVFFLHITSDPDNTNNIMALAFGVFIVFLVIGGSVWIMDHLNTNMMPMGQMAPAGQAGQPGQVMHMHR